MELSNFRGFFADSPTVRVMDFFLDNRVFSYSLADVIRDAGMGANTVRPVWKAMITNGVLTLDGKSGKAMLYRVNLRSSIVQRMIALDNALNTAGNNTERKRQKARRKITA